MTRAHKNETLRRLRRTGYLLTASCYAFFVLAFAVTGALTVGFDRLIGLPVIVGALLVAAVFYVLSGRVGDAYLTTNRINDVKAEAELVIKNLPDGELTFAENLKEYYKSARDESRAQDVLQVFSELVAHKKRAEKTLIRLAGDFELLTPWSERSDQSKVFRGYYMLVEGTAEKNQALNEALGVFVGRHNLEVTHQAAIVARDDEPPAEWSETEQARFVLDGKLDRLELLSDRLTLWDGAPGLLDNLLMRKFKRAVRSKKLTAETASQLIFDTQSVEDRLKARIARQTRRYFGKTLGLAHPAK